MYVCLSMGLSCRRPPSGLGDAAVFRPRRFSILLHCETEVISHEYTLMISLFPMILILKITIYKVILLWSSWLKNLCYLDDLCWRIISIQLLNVLINYFGLPLYAFVLHICIVSTSCICGCRWEHDETIENADANVKNMRILRRCGYPTHHCTWLFKVLFSLEYPVCSLQISSKKNPWICSSSANLISFGIYHNLVFKYLKLI